MRDEQFERLYADHAQALFGFLSYRTGDRVLAEDLLADTFERALRARRRFDPRKASEKTWLYAIALNLLRDSARRRAAEGRALERVTSGLVPGLAGTWRRSQIATSSAAASLVLSEEEREAIALRLRSRSHGPGDRKADQGAAHHS